MSQEAGTPAGYGILDRPGWTWDTCPNSDASPRRSPRMSIEVGSIVRDRKWGGSYTGTVTNIQGGSVFVQWHGTSVEDELLRTEITPAPDVPAPANNGFRPLIVGATR